MLQNSFDMLEKENIVYKKPTKKSMGEDINFYCLMCAAPVKNLSKTETEADERLGMELEPSAAPAAPRQNQVTTNAPIPDQISMDIQTDSQSSVPSSTTVVTTNGPSHILTSVQCYATLRSQVLRICHENSERIMQWFEAYINQGQVYKEVARLKEELENARSEKTVAFERAKVLEERLKEQTERLQTESKQSQETEAARSEVLREYRALKYEMTKKNEELSSLKDNITMIEKRRIEVEQRNSGISCIRKSLTVRISRLKDISTTIKLGHFQHLLGHIDALGRI
ncbi:hypothetical protein PVAP13_2KG089000 [Panicum virgatum]|uniref:Uncharacterized protein n=3 Tax=Panicum virgatum TaxID=38727 RepID=A0A8T0W110_PANVG|nr:hypothetical protein PVAP13_2KG089000 [Panicum virgatum]